MDDRNTEKLDKRNNKESFSILEMTIDILTRWRRVLLISLLVSAILSAIVAFLIPPKFKSSVSVFSAERTDLFSALEGVSSQLKSLSSARGLASLTGNPELEKYITILKSGRVLSAVINKFDLVKVYNITSYPMEKTSEKLLENTEFIIENDNALLVTVYDEDPQRAAEMANYFVEMLNKTNTEIQGQNARGTRQFIEERYEKNLVDLTATEDTLKEFQKKYGIIALTEQTEASIKAAAEIYGQLAFKEIQANVLRRTQSSDNPAVIATQIEIDELNKKLNRMNKGVDTPPNETTIFVPFSKVPDLGSEYIRRFREVEIQYKILQFITPIYEQAKVEERRNTPSVVVLDKAFPAERKSKPKRLLIIIGGIFIGFISTFFYAVANERWTQERKMNTSLYQTGLKFIMMLKEDYRSIRLFRRTK